MILAALRSNARSAPSTSLPDAPTAAVKQLSMPAQAADLLDQISKIIYNGKSNNYIQTYAGVSGSRPKADCRKSIGNR